MNIVIVFYVYFYCKRLELFCIGAIIYEINYIIIIIDNYNLNLMILKDSYFSYGDFWKRRFFWL